MVDELIVIDKQTRVGCHTLDCGRPIYVWQSMFVVPLSLCHYKGAHLNIDLPFTVDIPDIVLSVSWWGVTKGNMESSPGSSMDTWILMSVNVTNVALWTYDTHILQICCQVFYVISHPSYYHPETSTPDSHQTIHFENYILEVKYFFTKHQSETSICRLDQLFSIVICHGNILLIYVNIIFYYIHIT